MIKLVGRSLAEREGKGSFYEEHLVISSTCVLLQECES